MKNQNVIEEKTNELLSGYCYEGLREAALNWQKSLGTEGENEASMAYISMLKESIMPIDEVIDLFAQPFMADTFGPEKAKAIHDHAVEVKANGGVFCDCPACTKAQEILSVFES